MRVGSPETRIPRGLMALPLVLAGAISLWVAGAWGLIGLALAAALLFETPAKYPALVIAGALWLFAAALVMRLLPDWAFLILFFAASLCVARIVIVIGKAWGEARYAAMARAGKPMREWEWVYTGRSFVQSHPLGRGYGGVFFVIALVFVQAGLLVWAAATGAFFWSIALGGALFCMLTSITLLKRHPAGWPLAWLHLTAGFPFTLPLIVYWADGVRPNLIYRHRFERLVPQEDSNV